MKLVRVAEKGARRAVAWLRRRARRSQEAHGVVLLYHRIARASVDPWRLCVSPEHFDSQLRALRGQCDVVPLTRLRSELRRGRRSRPVVAITFDDGYRDNLEVAKPLLERHAAPATVFVITGSVGREDGFWWERLARATLEATSLPGEVTLQSGVARFTWRDDALADSARAGAVARRGLHDRLWEWLADLPDADRCAALQSLERWAGTVPAGDGQGHPMSVDELRSLGAGGLVEIGAHTVSHPRLSRAAGAVKRDEIFRSREDCRRILGRAPDCFSYPNGDYDPESIALVRDCGFALACTSHQELVWASADAFAMPRISVRDEPGESLLRHLRREWLN